MMPAGDQQQHAGQVHPLSTRRELSSIKRRAAEGDSKGPAHLVRRMRVVRRGSCGGHLSKQQHPEQDFSLEFDGP